MKRNKTLRLTTFCDIPNVIYLPVIITHYNVNCKPNIYNPKGSA